MKVYIFTEGGSKSGLGHIARCFALYQAFKRQGDKPLLILQTLTKGESPHVFAQMLVEIDPVFCDWRKSPHGCIEKIEADDIVVIDSYLAENTVYESMASQAGLLVSLDDLSRITYPPGIILNGALKADELPYLQTENRKYMLGLSYALIGDSFQILGRKEIRPQVRQLMLTVGGSDPHNITTRLIRYFQNVFPQLELHIIIGPNFSHQTEIARLKGGQTVIYDNPAPKAMVRIMEEADIAITAGGQTLLELAAVGTPALVMALADNQIGNIQGMERAGTSRFVGWYNEPDFLEQIKNGILSLKEQSVRHAMSERGRALVDGQGACRAAREISDYFLRRQAYEWRT